MAVAKAPNGDAIFAQTPGTALGAKIKMTRFTSAGAQIWSNVYNIDGNCKVREITRGTATSNCRSPLATPAAFLVVGDATINSATGASQA